MTSNSWRSWPDQTPSADFAERTVARILRDREERRPKRGARRWMTFAAAAAVLMAGGAWAWTSLPRPMKPPAVVQDSGVARPPAPPRALATTIKPLDPIPEVTRQPPVAPVIVPPRRKEAPTAVSLPDGGRKLILPACNCQDVLCACLDQH